MAGALGFLKGLATNDIFVLFLVLVLIVLGLLGI